MKQIKTCVCSVLLAICFLGAHAQETKIPLNEPDYNKPKLFADLPQKMDLNLSDMVSLFQNAVGDNISIKASAQFVFSGTVIVSSTAKDSSLRTVMIRSSNRAGAFLSFTMTKNSKGEVNYLGRILSRNNGDAFEIVKENGLYILQKKNLYDLISE